MFEKHTIKRKTETGKTARDQKRRSRKRSERKACSSITGHKTGRSG